MTERFLKNGEKVVRECFDWAFHSQDGYSPASDPSKKNFPVGIVQKDQTRIDEFVWVLWPNGSKFSYPFNQSRFPKHNIARFIEPEEISASFPIDRPLNKEELDALGAFHERNAVVLEDKQSSWKQRMLGND